MKLRGKSIGYRDIYSHYRDSILKGALLPGARVASIRALAAELAVAKRTVEWAYDLLIGEGYLVSQGAKGTVVNPALAHRRPKGTPGTSSSSYRSHFPRPLPRGTFQPGVPAFDAIPEQVWQKLAGRIARKPVDLDHPDPQGYPPLRKAIAAYLGLSRGVSCDPEQIFITNGYADSLPLILRTLRRDGDKLVIEEPGYFNLPPLLRASGISFRLSPARRNGLDVERFLLRHADARFVVVTPTHHSPLVGAMPLESRLALLNWARSQQSWIIEDDYDGEFHYDRRPIPALKSHDEADRVLYVGTFGKTLFPGLRIGYLVVPRSTQPQFHEVARTLRAGQAVFIQRVLASFLEEGHYYRHLKKMRGLYHLRRGYVIEALRLRFPELRVEHVDGGLLVVGHLDEKVDDQEIARRWREQGVSVLALSTWFQGPKKKRGLVFGFTNIRSGAEALRLLASVKL